MARYVIQNRKIWDKVRKEYVLLSTKDPELLKQMCAELNKPRKRTPQVTFYNEKKNK